MNGKRTWTLLLGILLACGLAGCGGKTKEEGEKSPEKQRTPQKKPGDGKGGTLTVSTQVSLPTAEKPIDTQYISEDFFAAVVLHPARALESKLGRGIIAEAEKELGKKKVADAFDMARQKLGVDPRKVEQVVVLIDRGVIFRLFALFGGRGAEKEEPRKFPSKKECDDSLDEVNGDCQPDPKGFPAPARRRTPMNQRLAEAAMPSFIVRFSEPPDQKAILQKLMDALMGRAEKKPEKGGPAFPSKTEDGKKPSSPKPAPAFPKKTSGKTAPEKKEPEKTGEEAGCGADDRDFLKSIPQKTLSGKTCYLLRPYAVCFVDGKTLLAAPENLLEKMIPAKDVKSPLTDRLRTLGDEHDLVLAADVQPLTMLLQNVDPKELSKDEAEVLPFVKKIQSLAITGSISGPTLVSVVAKLPTEKDAADFAALIRDKGLSKLEAEYRKIKQESKKVPAEAQFLVTLGDQMMAGLAVNSVKTDVIVSVARPAELDNLPSRLGPALKVVRRAAQGASRKNDLRQIGLALHNYHDAHGHFPAADSNGYWKGNGRKAGLSWRVHLLPQLRQHALYKQFNLDEPWDSPKNKALISRMPLLFANPAAGLDAVGGKTSLHVFVGKNNTPFSSQFGGVYVGGRFADILDGTSNTIAVVEAGPDNADVWTKPGGLPFDPAKNPFDVLGRIPDNGFLALFCDGAVYTIQKSRSPDDLKSLIQHADGKYVSPTGEPPFGAGSRGATDSRKR